jgi:DNA invertase Pin-like site-specific DNA recombinase
MLIFAKNYLMFICNSSLFAEVICKMRARKMAVLGYARVSTAVQDLSTQLDALKAAGAATVYREKISGARADRPQLAKMMAALRAGDIVVVTKLDRLGRSTRELLNLIHNIGEAGAAFRSLGDPLWDTSSSQGRLLATTLAGIADFERDLIRERTIAGRERAMAAGIKFGRKPKLSDYQRKEAIKRRGNGETLKAIADSYDVSIAMISRLQSVNTRTRIPI